MSDSEHSNKSESSELSSLSESSTDEEEDLCDYKRGGYHPVSIGDRFCEKRYRALRKMGWGRFSTVWLAWDVSNSRPVALKIPQAQYSDDVREEIEIIKKINETPNDTYIIKMYDHFVHRGVNGTHTVMALELLGPTLCSLIKQSKQVGLSPYVVKRVAVCVLKALEHIHTIRVIHSDLKPENILCVLSPTRLDSMIKKAQEEWEQTKTQVNIPKDANSDPRVKQTSEQGFLEDEFLSFKVADFGNASDKFKIDDIIQTRYYRCPEVLIQAKYGTTADIWSLACILFEAATANILFYPKKNSNWSVNEHHLSLIIKIIGRIPKKLARSGNNSRLYFNRDGQLHNIRNIEMSSMENLLYEEYQFETNAARHFSSFLTPMLDFSSSKRASAATMLQHPWLSDQVIT
jgi:serine/threonine-protein kinase SRPK3